MTTKTRKPAPIPARKESPIQKKNASSAKSLPSARNNLEEQKNKSTIAASVESIIYQRKAADHKEAEEQFKPIQRKDNNTGLPDNLKSGVENLSGFSMDDVKVHYNSSKPAQLNALAYAQGTDIHVGAGQEKHLPHEAWHVVQQKQGRVQATVQMKGISINDDTALEKEADEMGGKAGTVQQLKRNLQTGSKAKIIQRKYNRVTGLYDDRPDANNTFYPTTAIDTQKAHKVPWDLIKQTLNQALTLSTTDQVAAMALFDKVVAFSGKPFAFPPNFQTELALAPAARSNGFGITINALAKQACWTEWNIGRTPKPEHRLAAAGGDDPGNAGTDLNYTASGHTTPRSFEAEDVQIKGGISAIDPVELTNRLNNLKDKSGAAENKNAVIPYDPTKWENVGNRITNAGASMPTYRSKNNPNNWNGPFAEIKYPRENDTITSGSYTLRIKVNNKTNNVQVKIQKAGTDGQWVQARKDGDNWWFDWNNIEAGTYEIFAKAFHTDGRDWVSRKVTMTKR